MPRIRYAPFTTLDEERAALDQQWQLVGEMWASIAAEWHKIEQAKTTQHQRVSARLNVIRPYGLRPRPQREGGPDGRDDALAPRPRDHRRDAP